MGIRRRRDPADEKSTLVRGEPVGTKKSVLVRKECFGLYIMYHENVENITGVRSVRPCAGAPLDRRKYNKTPMAGERMGDCVGMGIRTNSPEDPTVLQIISPVRNEDET